MGNPRQRNYRSWTPEESKRKTSLVLNAWDGGELSLTQIVADFHVPVDFARTVIGEAIAAGTTKRVMKPKSTRFTSTGRP